MRRVAPRRRRGLLHLAATVVLAGVVPTAWASTTCEDICDTPSGACSIPDTEVVEPDSEIDCSGRHVVVTGSGTLKVTDGDFTLIADDLTVEGTSVQSGTITAVEGPEETPGSITIDLAGNLVLYGKIRANGQRGGGIITVTTAGDILIPEAGTDGIEADGTGSGASGGEIYLEAGGSITIYDPIHAAGASAGDTGGGIIEITAGGDLLTDQHGHINAPGRSDGGGEIRLTSLNGDVILREHVEADGIGQTGNGGSIQIHAGDRVEIAEELYARGGFRTGGGEASGGSVRIEAGCGGVDVGSSIYVHGGQLGAQWDGGAIEIDSLGTTAIGANVVLDTHAQAGGGEGGPILLTARHLVSVAGTARLDARGSTSSSGRGGAIGLRACQVDVQSGAILDTTGAFGGAIRLAASMTPPDTGAQPLTVGSASSLRAAGSVAANAGRIRATPLHLRRGVCSNNGAVTCFESAECTEGCQTGNCLYANPDTGGVSTQFDVAPIRADDRSISSCVSTCTQ